MFYFYCFVWLLWLVQLCAAVPKVAQVPRKTKQQKQKPLPLGSEPKTPMKSDNPDKEGFIPPHGGYRSLLSYQKSEIVYDGTQYFTRRFFKKYDRTIDQMVQAARSGKQNIAEASMASATSKETERKLTNVARASLEELRLDYEDYLRQRKLPLWDREDPRRHSLVAVA